MKQSPRKKKSTSGTQLHGNDDITLPGPPTAKSNKRLRRENKDNTGDKERQELMKAAVEAKIEKDAVDMQLDIKVAELHKCRAEQQILKEKVIVLEKMLLQRDKQTRQTEHGYLQLMDAFANRADWRQEVLALVPLPKAMKLILRDMRTTGEKNPHTVTLRQFYKETVISQWCRHYGMDDAVEMLHDQVVRLVSTMNSDVREGFRKAARTLGEYYIQHMPQYAVCVRTENDETVGPKWYYNAGQGRIGATTHGQMIVQVVYDLMRHELRNESMKLQTDTTACLEKHFAKGVLVVLDHDCKAERHATRKCMLNMMQAVWGEIDDRLSTE